MFIFPNKSLRQISGQEIKEKLQYVFVFLYK